MEPTISIIVPIYNVEIYLRQCVDSLLNQSYKNLEIILVDDESPDCCGEICDEYQLKDERIVVIHQKNQGLSGARNSGLEIATGNYIGFVDSDDWVGQEMYGVMLNLLLKYDLDIVECGVNQTNIEAKYNNPDLNIFFENSIEALQRIIKNSEFSVWRRLYKKEIIEETRFVVNRTSEDVYFVVENIPKIRKMGYFHFPFYNYRQNPNSITKSPYNFKRFDDSMSASLFLAKVITPLTFKNGDKNEELKHKELYRVIVNFMLNEFIYHYKMLNYHPNVDPEYIHRKNLKRLIDKKYFVSKTHDPYLKLAHMLSVNLFEVIINLNKARHRIFRTNRL